MSDSRKVKVGPGTLYAAVLSSAEPTSISGAWPGAWGQLGYTDAGSQFDYSTTVEGVEVEEELIPVRYTPTAAAGTLTFAMAEHTAKNLLIALNAGLTGDQATGVLGSITDGVYVEPPVLGDERRIMLGWDALSYDLSGDAFGRLIARQCYQAGSLSIVARKGNNKRLFACTFNLEKPSASRPFRAFFPNTLAS